MIINVYWFSCKVSRYSCQILMKLEFSRHIFEKILKLYDNALRGSQVVPCGRTDRHDEANSRSS